MLTFGFFKKLGKNVLYKLSEFTATATATATSMAMAVLEHYHVLKYRTSIAAIIAIAANLDMALMATIDAPPRTS